MQRLVVEYKLHYLTYIGLLCMEKNVEDYGMDK